MSKVVVVTTINDISEAEAFFGRQNIIVSAMVEYFAFGDEEGKIPLKELPAYLDRLAGEDVDVVICVPDDVMWSRWLVHSAAGTLERMGIRGVSVFSDIKRRWPSGAAFLSRDRAKFPHEQESLRGRTHWDPALCHRRHADQRAPSQRLHPVGR